MKWLIFKKRISKQNSFRNKSSCTCAYDQLSQSKPISSEYKKHFIEVCKLVHNNKYDYSKTVYINSETKLLITCPIHGDFYQLPMSHIHGKGCSKCGDISMA